MFLSMLRDRDAGQIRNNAAYCLTMAGRFAEAMELYESVATTSERNSALWIHNVGVLNHLTGNSDEGIELLRKAFDAALIQEKDELSVHCMMIFNKEGDSVSSMLASSSI